MNRRSARHRGSLIDSAANFAGTVTIWRLLLAEPDQAFPNLKMEPLLSLEPDAKGDEVFELFDKYNLRSLTVVDENNTPSA